MYQIVSFISFLKKFRHEAYLLIQNIVNFQSVLSQLASSSKYVYCINVGERN